MFVISYAKNGTWEKKKKATVKVEAMQRQQLGSL
jgi:hypothetical protein